MTLKAKIDPTKFKSIVDGKEINLNFLTNSNGIEVAFTNFGQRLVSLKVPDKNGNFDDIVLGFSTIEEYVLNRENYFGATIGRFGNRIANGKFSIENEKFNLLTNNGNNHLHGGKKGFHNVVWDTEQCMSNEITFFRTSRDMEEGYPGNLKIKVKYRLTDTNELIIEYLATTDKTTIINLTHHSFFNLKGEGNGSINDHSLMINANHYTPINQNLIPTGQIDQVKGTVFDFTSKKLIGRDLKKENQQLIYGNGYDHNFVLNRSTENSIPLAAKVSESITGRTLEVYTNEPGLQFYGGNFLDGSTVGKNGKPHVHQSGFCLETQHFPDSPNQLNFPSTLLKPGEEYGSTCIYKFGVV